MTVKRYIDFADGDDLSEMDVAFMTAMRGQRDKLVGNLKNQAAAQYNLSAEPYGGFRRILCGTFVLPSSGELVYVLDDSLDWRDRLLLVHVTLGVALSVPAALYPGHRLDGAMNIASNLGVVAIRPYYTGSGYADPGASVGVGYCLPLYDNLTDQVVIYAHSTAGDLRLQLKGGAEEGPITLFGMILAGPKLNARGATVGRTYVTTSTLFDAVNDTPVEPHDLNNAQDGTHLEQMTGPDTLPIGPIGHGDPPFPYEWNVRGETKRQALLEPALRRYVSMSLAADETLLLDNSFDWRDRIVWGLGMKSETVDRRPGQASDSGSGLFNQADCEPVLLSGYTGPGDVDTPGSGNTRYVIRWTAGSLFIYADVETGHLYVSSNASVSSDASLTLDLFLYASPRLGPRSKGPDRFEEPLPSTKVNAVLVDSVSVDMTNIVARWRMDRGLVLDGGLTAAIADQTGNGYHLRQLSPALRASAPEAEPLLNGADAIAFTGTEYYETVLALPASDEGYHIGFILAPSSTSAVHELWRMMLPLSSDGQIRGPISGTLISSQWMPNASATPAFETQSQPTPPATSVYTAGSGMGLAWDFTVDPSDPARLYADLSVRQVGAAATPGVLVAESPSGVGAADVQSLVLRIGEGFVGRIAEIIVCSAGQASLDAFLSSADIESRYGF